MEPGIFIISHYSLHAFVDLRSDTTLGDFDGQITSPFRVVKISVVPSDTSKFLAIGWVISSQTFRINCDVWDHTGTYINTEKTTIKISAERSKFNVPSIYPVGNAAFVRNLGGGLDFIQLNMKKQ